MQVVQPYARIIEPDKTGIEMLRSVEYIGRISHRSEEAQTEDSYKRFIEAVVINKGDWSITEHVSVTIEAVISRGIQQEWTRHRFMQPTIESTRFVNYNKKLGLSFIMPEGLKDSQENIMRGMFTCSENAYSDLLSIGAAPEIARDVLPLALASKCIFTTNLRNLRYLFMARTTKETHREFRRVSIPLLKQAQQLIPILYDDILENEPQKKSIAKAR